MNSMCKMNDEWTYVARRVKNKPLYIKGEGFSSALFKDSKGVSVDKDNGRTEEDVIDDEQRLHMYYMQKNNQVGNDAERLIAIVAVDKEIIDEKNVCVENAALPENMHHALLKRSESEIALTSSQAKGLAKHARILKRL